MKLGSRREIQEMFNEELDLSRKELKLAKEEMEQYLGPLTEEQAAAVLRMSLGFWSHAVLQTAEPGKPITPTSGTT